MIAITLSPELNACYEAEGYENRVLGQYEIKRRLDTHGCGWHIVDGVLFAGNSLNKDEDIQATTNWTLFDLLAYLDY